MKTELKWVRGIIVSTLLAGAWSVAPAQQDQDTQSGSTNAAKGSDASGNLDRKDRTFIEKAAKDGVAEVELGRLAQSNGSSDQVKEFGKHMEHEHGMANDELKRIAQSKGVSIPEQPDRSHARKAEKLGQESGAEFDRKYMAEMVKDHEKDLKFFREAAQNTKDPEIRSFAQKSAQKISEHLTMAKQIAGQVGANAGKAGTDKSEMKKDHRPNAESREDSGTPDTTARRTDK